MATKTINTTLEAPFAPELKASITIPTQKPQGAKKRVPLTVFLSPTGSNSNISVYCYSIKDHTKQKGDVYTSTLFGSDQSLVAVGSRVSRSLTTFTECPSYVGISGGIEAIRIVDYLKEMMVIIENEWGVSKIDNE